MEKLVFLPGDHGIFLSVFFWTLWLLVMVSVQEPPPHTHTILFGLANSEAPFAFHDPDAAAINLGSLWDFCRLLLSWKEKVSFMQR